MKVKNISIGINSLEESLNEFAHTVQDIREGHPPRKKIEGTYFVSLEAMRTVLTTKRLELLHTVREKEPHSIYELARLLKRDLKNVQDDVSLLARIGLLGLSRAKTKRARIIPRVEYDTLQLRIPMI